MRRRGVRPDVTGFGDWLQWGRRTYAAERCLREVAVKADGVAAMGPPHVCGGEPRGRTRRVPTRLCFNGAAARMRRRGRTARAHRHETRRLQWGRRTYAAESSAWPGAPRS